MNHDDDRIATMGEAVQEWAGNVGPDNSGCAWLLHDRDVWVKNPAYRGPPQPHPEDAIYMDEEPEPPECAHDWVYTGTVCGTLIIPKGGA